MGKGTAVRSQMDVRICLRVREKRDVDLILGQGSVNAGWRAHQFTQPGQFLISDPEHTAPERNRAYLIDDERIARHAAHCATTGHGCRTRPKTPQDRRRAANRPPSAQMLTAALRPSYGTRSPTASPARGLHRRPGSRVRPDPPVGLLPAPRARRSGPRRASRTRLLASRTAL